MKAVRIARAASLIGVILLATGCSSHIDQTSQAEMDRLKVRVSQLEDENQQLKTKLGQQDAATQPFKALAKQNEQSQPTKPLPALGQPSNIVADSSVSSQTNDQASHPHFADLDDIAQRSMIEELAAAGVFDGMTDKFGVDDKISRGEYAKLLYTAYNRLMPSDKQIHFAPSAPPFFKDLAPGHPDYKYVQALANAGFSVGYEDGSYRADQPITREEMIGMKVGVDCGKTFDPYRGQMAFVWKFSDSKDIDERFTGYVHQDYYVSGPFGSNIQRAFGKLGTFHPKYTVTRAEAAGTLWQMGQFGHQGHTAAAIL